MCQYYKKVLRYPPLVGGFFEVDATRGKGREGKGNGKGMKGKGRYQEKRTCEENSIDLEIRQLRI